MRTREWRCGITHSLTHGAACSCAYTMITLINISIVNRFVCRSECNYLPMQAFRLFDSLTHSIAGCGSTHTPRLLMGQMFCCVFFAISISLFCWYFSDAITLLHCSSIRANKHRYGACAVVLWPRLSRATSME